MWEHDSDYDEEGNYIWGEEGKDWDFYYKEDKEAYERGDNTVHPSILNPPLDPDNYEEVTKATGSNAANLYRTIKKVKVQKK